MTYLAPKKNEINKLLLAYLLIEEKFGTGKEKHMLRMTRGCPLGLEYLAAALERDRNTTVDILDQRITPFTPAELVKKLEKERYGAVGFYICTDPELEKRAEHTIRYIRERMDIPIIAGGPPFNVRPVLEAGCNMICHGEGERAAAEMLDALEKKIDRQAVRGITYLENGEEKRTPARALIDDLDSLPLPRRDREAAGKYYALGNPNMRRPYFSVLASRGCPMNCAYCSAPGMWRRKIRYRSPEGVLDEIGFLVRDFGGRYLSFRDDIFGVKSEWLEEFCGGMIRRNMPVRWICNMHPSIPREGVEETIGLLARAGCDTLHFGIQSGDPDILKRINRKPEEIPLLREKIAAAKKNGMLTFLEFIVGLPGETGETVQRSIEYAFSIRPAFVAVYSLGILKGAELHEEYELKNRPVTSMSREAIGRQVRLFRRRYMLNPRTVASLLLYVLRHNPLWLLTALKVISQGATMTGLGWKRKTF